jgi:hypothetical protein
MRREMRGGEDIVAAPGCQCERRATLDPVSESSVTSGPGFVRLLLPLSLAAAVCACSGDSNPVRDIAVKTGFGTERKDGPDFIRQSRPKELHYAPVGVAPPTPTYRAKSAPDVKAVQGEMDAIRAANEARAAEARRAAAVTSAPIAPVVPAP